MRIFYTENEQTGQLIFSFLVKVTKNEKWNELNRNVIFVSIITLTYIWEQMMWTMKGLKSTKIALFVSTGCLNMLCPTSNQKFFRINWHSKQNPLIFGILSRGDLCMENQFLGCLPYTASTASYLKDAIFLMIQRRKTC